MKLVFCAFLLIFISCVLGQNDIDDPMDPIHGPNEDCLRCICHARSGCFRLRNCANYSISKDYWIRAGSPVVLDDNPTDESAYTNCIKNDGCIMRAIRGYLSTMPDRDCNCDGVIDCKDYAAIHLKGDSCRSNFEGYQLNRLDKCLKDRGYSITEGWSMRCQLPGAQ